MIYEIVVYAPESSSIILFPIACFYLRHLTRQGSQRKWSIRATPTTNPASPGENQWGFFKGCEHDGGRGSREREKERES